MNIKSFSNSIQLTNVEDKIYLSIRTFDKNGKLKTSNLEVENILDHTFIKNFFNNNIKSIKCIKTHIGNNEYKECIELQNISNFSLIIISDNTEKYFNEVLDYVDKNRTKIYENYLFDCICKYPLKEIVFKLSNNGNNSEIKLNEVNNNEEDNEKKYTLTYYLPYVMDKKNKKVVKQEDIDLIQNTINNYFGITRCIYKGIYPNAPLGYFLDCKLYTDKAEISIESKEIYDGLELYIGMIRKEAEMESERIKHEEFLEHQKMIKKPKLFVLKKDNKNEKE